MKNIVLMLLLVLGLVACKGVVTGHEYTAEEISKAAAFLSVSEERMKMYKNGDITIEELGVSADRMRQAVEFVEGK